MNRKNSFYIKAVLASLYLLVLPVLLLAGVPKDVSGLVNETRTKVTGVGADYVFVDDATGFEVNDTVLIVQMKGDGILTANDGTFGIHQTHVGDVGYYEFIVIQLIESSPFKITFYNNLEGSYDPESFVQIVKVESYEMLNVTGELTCPPWDGVAGTGGVIAIFASDKIVLNSNINVSGKGFQGGTGVSMDGTCLEFLPRMAYYSEGSTKAGRKGEGYSSHDGAGVLLVASLYAKGEGAIGAGGGSGDGSLSGGGGGGSYGYGGVGGDEVGCGLPNPGGSGGYIINGFYNYAVIMGGGGGASGYSGGSSAPDGGNGGGLLFLMTDSIYGNGYSIMANGQSVTEMASVSAGGAGGGAAGTVVISANGYGISGVTLEAKGGNGGDTPNGTGYGGGGSGGLIWVSPAVNTYTTFDRSAGLSGNYSGISGSDGNPGPPERTNLAMRLNGFLFNTVATAADGNLLDSICFGQVPRALKASVPVGGTLPFTIYWEKSYTGVGGWVAISGTESGNIFTPDQIETSTLWIRRRIVDSSIPTIEDISKSVKVIVHPLITSFEIGHDTGDTICFNQDPTVIEPLIPTPGGGNLIYIYKWHQSPDGVNFDQTLLSGLPTYDPPALSDDTWYRRTVYSGACVDSTSSVKIRVLPVIGSNMVGPSDVICEGSAFTDLDGPLVTGGDDGYSYKWEASLDEIDWNHTIEGSTDQAAYDPDEASLDFPALTPKYYRRIVYSGEDDCCIDISPTVNLTMQPLIANNGITSPLTQTVCAEDPVVDDVIGTLPAGGDNSYSYQWQKKTTGSWADTSGATEIDLDLNMLYETTYFRRVVNSGTCVDIGTDEFVVTVQPKIIGNEITTLGLLKDTTICTGQDPQRLTGPVVSIGGLGGGTFTYLWEDKSSAHDWQPAPLFNTGIEYDPGILSETTMYRRIVYSGECESVGDTVSIIVLPVIAGNTIGSSQDICYGTSPALLTGTYSDAGLTGGAGSGSYSYMWESDSSPGFTTPSVEGGDTDYNFQPGNLTVPTYYRRTVKSGEYDCCQDISSIITIDINPLPAGDITPLQDEAICEGEDISLSLSVTIGTAPFTVYLTDGNSTQPLPVTSAGTLVHTLSPTYSSDQSLDYTLVSIMDANGCEATSLTGSKHVDLWDMPEANAGANDEWCGFDYTMDATASIGLGTWYWDGPSTIFTNVNDPKSVVSFSNFVGGDTLCTFWWKEVNVLSRCVDSTSADITFYKPPTIADAGNDSTLLPFQVDMLLYANSPFYGAGIWSVISGGGSMKTGNNDLPDGMVQGLSDGLNILEWRISNGICPESYDEVELTVPEVKLITGFSPNNDGLNDYFVIDGLVEWDGDIVENELVVTDMTGVILYREQNYGNDWDGRDMFGKPLSSGTYYYFINIFYSTKVQLKGFVIIKRD